MKVEQVMTSHVACISSNDTIASAAKSMQNHNIGFIPVCDNDIISGVVTDRDIVTRCIANDKNPEKTKVNEIMTQEVHTVDKQTNMSEVENIMSEHKIRRLPVTEDKKVVGIVSIGDIATHDGLHNKAKRTLTDISQPSNPMNI
jgi:CBS domain-containing protein